MNTKAMFSLSYGLFLLSTRLDGRDNACVINTAIQVASNPDRIAIAVNKGNYTNEILSKSDAFTLSVLSEDATFDLFTRFGFASGRDTDKFSGFSDVKPLSNGTLAVTKGTNAYLSAHIEERHDLGSHTLYIATLTDGDVLSLTPSATYAFYHQFIKPKPAEKKTGKTVWRCTVCGFEIEADELPDDYVCPICKHGKDVFEKVEIQEEVKNNNIKETTTMKKWVCPVCGYVHEGNEPPEVCPVCKVPGSKFTEMKGDEKLAAEHEFGIYAKTVKNNPDISAEDKAYILEQLKANFMGECSEVGMYLAMARVAHREGYAEVGLYWEKAAYEEAEHAAKFAELLGSELEPNMKATTKDNLAWRVACEYGAVKGKFDLATCAKKNGLDAIHDTVHEMARDEARHGKALEGFLKRLFK